jgi:hypothetical protein
VKRRTRTIQLYVDSCHNTNPNPTLQNCRPAYDQSTYRPVDPNPNSNPTELSTCIRRTSFLFIFYIDDRFTVLIKDAGGTILWWTGIFKSIEGQNSTLFHQGLNIISQLGTHFFLRFEGSQLPILSLL